MTELGKVVARRIGGIEVVCRELTVGQLRGMLQADIEGDLISDYLFEEARLVDLLQLTNLSREQIDCLPPSELRHVVEACREANPDFFGMLARAARVRLASLGN
jgi:hypothetical protein